MTIVLNRLGNHSFVNNDKKKSKKIDITPYDPNWPLSYELEAQRIQEALEDQLLSIYHIGSTSVTGLAGKPKIDILAEVGDLDFEHQDLIDLNYEYRGAFNLPLHKCFDYSSTERNVNLHIYEQNDSEIELNLAFRDYLRTHPDAKERYASLKHQLLKDESSHQKVGPVYNEYTLKKHDFIQNILKKAGFTGSRFVFCTYDKEWEAARKFRNKYFFGPNHIEDPYTWTFNHKDHKHFLFYQGVDIIGYAHVQLWPEKRAAIRIIVIDEHRRDQGFGGQFLNRIEKWLNLEGYRSVHAESSPNSLLFYRHQGYSEMPFKDHIFSSPSQASGVVLGRRSNGWSDWKDKKNNSLKENFQ